MATQDNHHVGVGDVPGAVWVAAALVALALAVVLHAVFPRYDYQVIGDDGRAVLVYDRWSGRFQRANYDASAEPSLSRVLTPF
jgi:hypothetical protein